MDEVFVNAEALAKNINLRKVKQPPHKGQKDISIKIVYGLIDFFQKYEILLASDISILCIWLA